MGYEEMVKWVTCREPQGRAIGNIHIDKLTRKFKIFINEKLPLKTNIDGVVKSQISWFFVIPANAGIQ